MTWRSIPGYEGIYDITPSGSVRSYYDYKTRKLKTTPDHLLKPRKGKIDDAGNFYGNPCVCLYKQGKRLEIGVKALIKLTFGN